jgi:hypothetical protein
MVCLSRAAILCFFPIFRMLGFHGLRGLGPLREWVSGEAPCKTFELLQFACLSRLDTWPENQVPHF